MLTASRRQEADGSLGKRPIDDVQRPTREGPPATGGYVPEIQGLRTIALVLVAVFHVWFDRVSGGVDIFLMISAFLMTRSLADRAERGALTNPVTFLLKKFSRLLPAAVAVIALTLGAIVVFMPVAMWPGFVIDALASLGYVENLRLQSVGADYFNANAGVVSPYQHYWSLSIQGQIFVLWAVAHLAAELFARLTRISVRKVLFFGFAAVFVISLWRSVWLTDFNQSYAYFDTVSRMWEFAAGSLLALIYGAFRASPAVREVMRWVGLAGVFSCAIFAPVESSFPGWIALWPVASAALVILSTGGSNAAATTDGGSVRARGGVAARLLSSRVLRKAGDHTYALYLVHWPVLVIFNHVAMTAAPNWWQGALVLAVSVALSVLIHWLVERPVSSWLTRAKTTGWSATLRARPVVAIGVAAVLVVGSGAAVNLQYRSQMEASSQALATADFSQIGANAPDLVVPSSDVIPGESMVLTDWASMGQVCDADDPYASLHTCYHLPPVPHSGEERSIFAVGNSHVAQLSGLLYQTAVRQPTWSGYVQVAPGCNYERSLDADAPAGCPELWPGAERYIREQQPDLVLVLATMAGGPGEREKTLEQTLEWVMRQRDVSPNTTFVFVRDNPRLGESPFECATASSFENNACKVTPEIDDVGDFQERVVANGFIWVDLNDTICPQGVCSPSQGGVVVYRDDNHLTGTYSQTLAQAFADQVAPFVTWWPSRPYEGDKVVDERFSGVH